LKRKDLIKKIESIGCIFVRLGGNHDWYKNPKNGKYQPIPREQKGTLPLFFHQIKQEIWEVSL